MAKKTEKKAESTETLELENQSEQVKDLIHSQIIAQKDFFKTNETKSLKWRLNQLKKLYNSIKKHDAEIMQALHTDLGKSEFEAYVTEEGGVLHEISVAKKNLKKWAKTKKISNGKIMAEPLGTVLIIAPWNYPFLLTLQPLVSSIAAGNTAVVKCSEWSPATNSVIKLIIEETFVPEHVLYVEPGYQQNQMLMKERFDFMRDYFSDVRQDVLACPNIYSEFDVFAMKAFLSCSTYEEFIKRYSRKPFDSFRVKVFRNKSYPTVTQILNGDWSM